MFCEAFMLNMNARIPRDVCVFLDVMCNLDSLEAFLDYWSSIQKEFIYDLDTKKIQKVTNMETLNITPWKHSIIGK